MESPFTVVALLLLMAKVSHFSMQQRRLVIDPSAWWDIYALNQNKGVAGGSSTTFARPVPLTVGNSSNVVIEDLSIIDSPFWHK